MLSVLFVTILFAAKGLPEDAKKALEEIPGQELRLNLILNQAIQDSDSYRELDAQKKASDLPLMYEKAKYEWQNTLSYNRSSDQLEQAAITLPSNIRSTNYSLGLSKYFSSGTSLSFDLSHGSQMFDVTNTTVPEFFDSKAELSFSQNLLKNAFGYSSRRSKEAAKKEQFARKIGFEKSFQNWSKNISHLFYRAWLSQAQAETALKSAKLKKRLMDVSRRKLKRGTTEKPDFLQIETSYLKAKSLQNDAEQDLQSAWQKLVLLAKLPMHWLDIDAQQIPIALDDPKPVAESLCQTDPKRDNYQIQELRYKSEAAQQRRKAAENNLYPDLKFNAGYAVNGIDDEAKTSLEEASEMDHEKWFVGLSLSYPFSNQKAKADLLSAKVEEQIAEAKKNSAISNLEADWMRLCSAYKIANRNYENAKKIYEKQNQRVRLEEKRFRIGRSNVFQAVQAGDDRAQAGFNLNRAEVERRRLAWDVIVLGDQVKKYLDSIGVSYK